MLISEFFVMFKPIKLTKLLDFRCMLIVFLGIKILMENKAYSIGEIIKSA